MIVLVGLWVVLAPAYSAATAVAAAAQTDMSGESLNGDNCCPEADVKRDLCKLMCLNAGQMAIALEPSTSSARPGSRYDRSDPLVMPGRLAGPDPAPPRSVSLL